MLQNKLHLLDVSYELSFSNMRFIAAVCVFSSYQATTAKEKEYLRNCILAEQVQ